MGDYRKSGSCQSGGKYPSQFYTQVLREQLGLSSIPYFTHPEFIMMRVDGSRYVA
jgi:hypothetical protein